MNDEVAQIWHDTQDPQNHGWAYRYRDSGGQEQSGPLAPTGDLYALAEELRDLAGDDWNGCHVYRGERLAFTMTRDGMCRYV